jgi:hypothetical protein
MGIKEKLGFIGFVVNYLNHSLFSLLMKCAICKEKIENTFLGKIKGTHVGKKVVCPACQKKHKNNFKEFL